MARRRGPEVQREKATDKSVFALEDSVDEIWLQAERVIRALNVFPDLKTHLLELRLGKKRFAFMPERHSLPLPDGAIAQVKWDEKMECWNLFEIKKAWGNERFNVRVEGNDNLAIEIEPIDSNNRFWLDSLRHFHNALVRLDERFLPFGESVDTEQLGGIFELSLDSQGLSFYSVYAGDAFLDPIHYQLELGRDDPACQQLCELMVRLLAQVFGYQEVRPLDMDMV